MWGGKAGRSIWKAEKYAYRKLRKFLCLINFTNFLSPLNFYNIGKKSLRLVKKFREISHWIFPQKNPGGQKHQVIKSAIEIYDSLIYRFWVKIFQIVSALSKIKIWFLSCKWKYFQIVTFYRSTRQDKS